MTSCYKDSGADVSATSFVLLSSRNRDTSWMSSLFVDAQGNALHVDSTRLAKVQLLIVSHSRRSVISVWSNDPSFVSW